MLEAVPPCDSRWCPRHESEVHRRCLTHGKTGVRFVELAIHGGKKSRGGGDGTFSTILLLVTVLCCTLYVNRKRIRRLVAKEKDEDRQIDEMELQSLTTTEGLPSA